MRPSIKLVTAIVRPLKLDAVLGSLARIGIQALTVSEIKDYGQKGQTEIYRGAEFTADHVTMTKIEAAIAGDQVDKVIAAILSVARTGKSGDGAIFISQLDQLLSIRTGSTDETVPPLAA